LILSLFLALKAPSLAHEFSNKHGRFG